MRANRRRLHATEWRNSYKTKFGHTKSMRLNTSDPIFKICYMFMNTWLPWPEWEIWIQVHIGELGHLFMLLIAHAGTSHYRNWCWLLRDTARTALVSGSTKIWFDSSRLDFNGVLFIDNNSTSKFLNCDSNSAFLCFFVRVKLITSQELAEVMTWHQAGDNSWTHPIDLFTIIFSLAVSSRTTYISS